MWGVVCGVVARILQSGEKNVVGRSLKPLPPAED
jgi:hypothetical protein